MAKPAFPFLLALPPPFLINLYEGGNWKRLSDLFCLHVFAVLAPFTITSLQLIISSKITSTKVSSCLLFLDRKAQESLRSCSGSLLSVLQGLALTIIYSFICSFNLSSTALSASIPSFYKEAILSLAKEKNLTFHFTHCLLVRLGREVHQTVPTFQWICTVVLSEVLCQCRVHLRGCLLQS